MRCYFAATTGAAAIAEVELVANPIWMLFSGFAVTNPVGSKIY